jgi:hypothetical protein
MYIAYTYTACIRQKSTRNCISRKICSRPRLTLADFLQVKYAVDKACMAGCPLAPPDHHTVDQACNLQRRRQETTLTDASACEMTRAHQSRRTTPSRAPRALMWHLGAQTRHPAACRQLQSPRRSAPRCEGACTCVLASSQDLARLPHLKTPTAQGVERPRPLPAPPADTRNASQHPKPVPRRRPQVAL